MVLRLKSSFGLLDISVRSFLSFNTLFHFLEFRWLLESLATLLSHLSLGFPSVLLLNGTLFWYALDIHFFRHFWSERLSSLYNWYSWWLYFILNFSLSITRQDIFSKNISLKGPSFLQIYYVTTVRIRILYTCSFLIFRWEFHGW